MSATEEQQKAEKEKSVPKDAQVMISILKDMGINEFEPRVVNQMLEFSYRFVSSEGALVSNAQSQIQGTVRLTWTSTSNTIPSP